MSWKFLKDLNIQENRINILSTCLKDTNNVNDYFVSVYNKKHNTVKNIIFDNNKKFDADKNPISLS